PSPRTGKWRFGRVRRIRTKRECLSLSVLYRLSADSLFRQAYAAQVCNVQANKIVVRVKRMGGGFGGKETRSVQLSSILALAAQKTRRPIRCMLTREEDMVTSGQRHPFLGRWKLGVNKDGKIQALDLDIFNNGGWSWDL